MIRVSVSLADATVTETETLTAGRVGLECGFTFTTEWDGLLKVAVFEGAETIEVALGLATVAVVPPECMATPGYALRVGVYGLSPANAIVIPTVWAKAGKIKDSAAPDDESFAPATPELVAQILGASQDALNIARSVENRANNGEFDGTDGVSPTVSAQRVEDGVEISITDVNGTTEAKLNDGTNGVDGVSPGITITDIEGGHRVTITDADHPSGQSFDVMDGQDSTTDYDQMSNRPSINGHTLTGDQTAAQLNLVAAQAGMGLSQNSFTDEEKAVLDSLFFVDRSYTYAQVETAYSAGKKVMFFENGELFPVLLHPTNQFIFIRSILNGGNRTVTITSSANWAFQTDANPGNFVKFTSMSLTDDKKEQARTNIGAASADLVDDLKSALKSGNEEDAIYHLGFYLDENGDLCQVEEKTNNG